LAQGFTPFSAGSGKFNMWDQTGLFFSTGTGTPHLSGRGVRGLLIEIGKLSLDRSPRVPEDFDNISRTAIAQLSRPHPRKIFKSLSKMNNQYRYQSGYMKQQVKACEFFSRSKPYYLLILLR
jgi:hypothetical protein